MGMPDEKIKEALGQAYVHAVAAVAGYNVAKDEQDFGIDGTIKDVVNREGRYASNGFCIEYQLKSTSNVSFEDEWVVYDLESKNYNDLATWQGANPAILILFLMPREKSEWIEQQADSIQIRNCAWWHQLQSEEITDNLRTKRIRIPRKQVFTPESLIEMMKKVERGEGL